MDNEGRGCSGLTVLSDVSRDALAAGLRWGVGSWGRRGRHSRPDLRGPAYLDAFHLDRFQTDSGVFDRLCARGTCRELSLLFLSLIDPCSGDNSRSSTSCLSEMHMTSRRVRMSCVSRPQFRPSRPRRMAWSSRTCTGACMCSTRNSSPSRVGSRMLVDA